jgi:hypothetical protein
MSKPQRIFCTMINSNFLVVASDYNNIVRDIGLVDRSLYASQQAIHNHGLGIYYSISNQR